MYVFCHRRLGRPLRFGAYPGERFARETASPAIRTSFPGRITVDSRLARIGNVSRVVQVVSALREVPVVTSSRENHDLLFWH